MGPIISTNGSTHMPPPCLPSINRCSLTCEELSSGCRLGSGVQGGKPERQPQCSLQDVFWGCQALLQLWVRNLSGKEMVLVGWLRGLHQGACIGSSAEGKLVWEPEDSLREQEKGLEYRSRDQSTAEPFSPPPLSTMANQNWTVGMNWDSHCYCPSPPESRGGKEFKELSNIT